MRVLVRCGDVRRACALTVSVSLLRLVRLQSREQYRPITCILRIRGIRRIRYQVSVGTVGVGPVWDRSQRVPTASVDSRRPGVPTSVSWACARPIVCPPGSGPVRDLARACACRVCVSRVACRVSRLWPHATAASRGLTRRSRRRWAWARSAWSRWGGRSCSRWETGARWRRKSRAAAWPVALPSAAWPPRSCSPVRLLSPCGHASSQRAACANTQPGSARQPHA